MKFLELSKEVSYALRHAPWEYELEIDETGWVPIQQLINALKMSDKWSQLDVYTLQKMIKSSEKKRHEIQDNRIRALYGHSVVNKIIKEEKKPPHVLFHGTSRKSLTTIMSEGLTPQTRQYVHLSVDIETAIKVGKRRDHKPKILKVYASEAC